MNQEYYVYFIKLEDGSKNNLYKIGRSSGDPQKRLSAIQTHNPYNVILIGIIKRDTEKEIIQLESDFHKAFDDYRFRGEWFNLQDSTVENLIESVSLGPCPHVDADNFNLKYTGVYRSCLIWVEKQECPEIAPYFAVIENTKTGLISTQHAFSKEYIPLEIKDRIDKSYGNVIDQQPVLTKYNWDTNISPKANKQTDKDKLIEFICTVNTPVSPKDIKENLPGFGDKTIQNITQMVYRLYNDGMISKIAKGQYVSLDFNSKKEKNNGKA